MLILAALAIVFSLVILARPFTRVGFPSGHDARAHITYTFLFDRALEQGQFPVRWVEWVRNGESQPLFSFYPPGLYYLVEVVHLVVPRLSTALKSTVVIVWWAGAVLTFLWLKPFGWIAAGLAAVLFAWSPYVIVDVFVRAAYPEHAAIALAPGLLWSIDRLKRRRHTSDAPLVAIFVGAMLVCHLLTSLIIAPVVAAYAVYRLYGGPEWRREVTFLASGALLGVGMSAFFLLPAMAELGHVAIERMTSGYTAYEQHFVAPSQWFLHVWRYGGSVADGDDGMPFQISLAQWLAIGLAIAQLARTTITRRRAPHTTALAFWLVMSLSAMFMMTEHSSFVWRVLPALAYLQFPWRYFVLVSLGTAALAGLLVASVPSRALQAVAVLVVLVWLHDAYGGHLRPLQNLPLQEMNIDDPRWPEIEHEGIPAFIARGFTPVSARRDAPARIARWTVVEGTGDVRERRRADHDMAMEVTTREGMRLRINSHDFPGWIVQIDGRPTETTVDEYGFMTVIVPPGTHSVEARLTNTPVRTLANVVSVMSVGVWVVACFWAIASSSRATDP